MAYNEAAEARQRCTGTKRDGTPCRAWALWDDPRQLCVQHAGRGHRGKRTGLIDYSLHPARYRPCTCPAYAWPHRPGGGLCRWPLPPHYMRTTPAGTHAWPRFTGDMKRITRLLDRHYRGRRG